jgi:hypothetical protein
MTLIIVLVIVNIPVYLSIGWLAFDSVSNAIESLTKVLFGRSRQMIDRSSWPEDWRIFRILRDDGDDEELYAKPMQIANVLGFFAACALIVYGEYYLIQKYWH